MAWLPTSLLCLLCMGGEQREIRYVMGTIFSVSVPETTPVAVISEAFDLATEIERLGTTYDAKSPLMQLRRGEPSFFELPERKRKTVLGYIDRAATYMARSEGAFHPATGEQPFPSREAIREARERYADKETKAIPWDLGAMLKGTAIDAMIAHFKSKGVAWALVNGGGDLRWYGKMQHIVIRQPGAGEENRPLLVLDLEEGALATSANDRRFARGSKGQEGHIRQPSRSFVGGMTQVSILADTAEAADAWATAVFVAGAEKAKDWAPTYHFSGALLDDQGTIHRIGGQRDAFRNP